MSTNVVRTKPFRQPTNVSLPKDLVAEARALRLNLSQACERGLELAVSEARAARWLKENRKAIEASNAYVDAHGLPLAELRQF